MTPEQMRDASLLELFSLEAEAQTQVLSAGLLALERNPTQADQLEACMRAAHSLKGAARIVGVHVLKNILIPIVTVAGSNLAHMFGGSLIIEQVFSIPGIGLYLINAVNTRDYPVAQSSVVFLSILFSLIVLLTDLGYAAVDPIIRAQFVQGGTKKKKLNLE